jgi:uncharacterized protein with HEPN domain
MILAGEEVVAAVESVDLEAFLADRMRQKAVMRDSTVIGEAAGHLPDELRALAGEVPWLKIIALRHRLVHGYFGVDLPVVYETARPRVPELLPALRSLLRKVEGAGGPS